MSEAVDHLVAEFTALTSEIEGHREKISDLAAVRVQVIRRLHFDEGLSMREVGRRCGISHVRVHEIIHEGAQAVAVTDT